MMEPRRLLEDDDHPAARALLGAALHERPPDGAAGRAMVALGVASAGMAAAAVASAAAGGAKQLSGFSLAAIAKWFGGGAVVGLVAAAGAVSGSDAGWGKIAGAQVAPAAIEPASQPQRWPAIEPRAEREPEPAADQPSPSAPVAAPPVSASKSTSAADQASPSAEPSSARFEPGEDPLSSEVRLLDEARRAIASGGGATALAVLDSYDSRHPAGRLAPEAFVLRLDALVRSGRMPEARQLAEQHLARNPTGAHADRIRKIVGAP
jgi:hypothetical protein